MSCAQQGFLVATASPEQYLYEECARATELQDVAFGAGVRRQHLHREVVEAVGALKLLQHLIQPCAAGIVKLEAVSSSRCLGADAVCCLTCGCSSSILVSGGSYRAVLRDTGYLDLFACDGKVLHIKRVADTGHTLVIHSRGVPDLALAQQTQSRSVVARLVLRQLATWLLI